LIIIPGGEGKERGEKKKEEKKRRKKKGGVYIWDVSGVAALAYTSYLLVALNGLVDEPSGRPRQRLWLARVL